MINFNYSVQKFNSVRHGVILQHPEQSRTVTVSFNPFMIF